MTGVKDVIWSEIISVVGRKISISSSIIDKIGLVQILETDS
jgi:hypothetical protein